MGRTIIRLLLVSALLGAAGSPGANAQTTFTRMDTILGLAGYHPTYGPSWGDYTADGLPDIFVGNHGDTPTLYRNNGTTSFVDEWPGSGILGHTDQHGSAWGDFDNDGLPDLYISIGADMGAGNGYNELYHNLDGHHFEEIGLAAGVQDPSGRGRFVSWIDADNDGWLDLFAANMDSPNCLFLNQGGYSFVAAPDAGGLAGDDLWYDAWSHADDDRLLDVILSAVTTGRLALYRNSEGGIFHDITAESGLPSTLWGVRGFCWLDYDNDGDQDLYVSRGNFSCGGDALWFEEQEVRALMLLPSDETESEGFDGLDISAEAAGLTFEVNVDWAPQSLEKIFLGPDGVHPPACPFTMADGEYVGTPSFTPGSDHGCYLWQDQMGGAWHVRGSMEFGDDTRFGLRATPVDGLITAAESLQVEVRISTANVADRLYRHRADGTFENVSAAAGISDTRDGRSCLAADFDCDGWLDIYVVSARNLSGYWAENEPNLCYHNNGNGTFTEYAAAAGITCEVPGTGAGAAWADYDDDGFPDLCVTNGWACFPFSQGPHVVFRNDGTAHHWLKVRLTGRYCNRDGVGTRVRVRAGGLTQVRVQNGGVADMSQSTAELHFGLGSAGQIDSLTVEWPDGVTEHLLDLPADQTLLLVEDATGQMTEDPSAMAGVPAPRVTSPSAAPIRIFWELPAPHLLRAAVYDVRGGCLCRLTSRDMRGRPGTIEWDGRGASGAPAPAGIYYVRLRAGPYACSHRVALVR